MFSSRRTRYPRLSEAELDITAFMNLMIVLVPVLLLSMVFTHIRIVDLQLPAPGTGNPLTDKRELELILRGDLIDVNFPQGVRVRRIERAESGFDFRALSDVLQEIKRQLRDEGIDRDNLTILAEERTSYQDLVNVIDTARSFRTVVAASVVDAELFPDIALGDAPAGYALAANSRNLQ